MFKPLPNIGHEQVAGLLFVLALHATGLVALWSSRTMLTPVEAAMLTVSLIASPSPQLPKPPSEPLTVLKPRQFLLPMPQPLAVEVPVVADTGPLATIPAPAPSLQPEGEVPPQPQPSPQPAALSADLAVTCSEHSSPSYPQQSRRMNEQGKVLLRLELDEAGRLASAEVKASSGFPRLDEAALSAVRTWRCNPSMRNGIAVRTRALQPFNFSLERS
jgi:protein TonB